MNLSIIIRNPHSQDDSPYVAPELVSDEAFDFRVDIWNVGIVLFELIHGYPPFKTKEEILQGNLKFEDISLDAKNLLFSLLRPNPEDRLELLSIFNDPWMMKHQQEFKIDFNQYLYKSSSSPVLSKTESSSKKPPTSSESLSQTTPVKVVQAEESHHENPFTSPPPRKTLPSSNNVLVNSEKPSYRKADNGLEMSFEDKRTEQNVDKPKEEPRQITSERVSSSDVLLMRKSKSGERTSFITAAEKIHSPKKK